jgi:3-oxoacyl-[acyl-carrier-protein] synthase II
MMNINGIGIICNYGRGIDAFKLALENGQAQEIFTSRVNDDILKDKIFSKDARRSDRFDRMAVLAAFDAITSSGINSEVEKNNIGIILATGFGPHATTFRFLDDILTYKEPDVSPTLFSHSVHNAAVSYISCLTGIRGPTLTVTRFSRAFDEALSLAKAWLEQKKVRFVLVGAVDELSSIMEYITKPLPALLLGEGSVFFMVSQEKCAKIYSQVDSLTCLSVAAPQPIQSAFNCAAEIILKIYRKDTPDSIG